MRINRFFGIIVFSLILLSGCQTRQLVVKVYSPSVLELPPDIKGVLVFNRFVPATGDYDRVKWGAYDTVDSTLWTASDSCASSFSNSLNSFKKFTTMMPEGVRMFRHNGMDLPDALPWEGLVKIAEKYYADAIAILESFGIEKGEVKLTQLENGFQAELPVIVMNGWRIYQPARRRILDETVYKYNHSFTASGSSREEAIKALPNDQECLIQAALLAGQEYARKINPLLIDVKRKLYSKGSQVIEDGYAFILEDKWGKAEAKWKYNAYNGETDEIKAMCSYNMAVLSEKEGFLNIALGYARRAQKLMPAKLHLDYINELTIRVLDLDDKYNKGEIIKNW